MLYCTVLLQAQDNWTVPVCNFSPLSFGALQFWLSTYFFLIIIIISFCQEESFLSAMILWYCFYCIENNTKARMTAGFRALEQMSP